MFFRTVFTGILFIIGFVIVVAILGYIYISSGYYNIAATQHHMPLTLWAISIASDNSVRHNSEYIVAPDDILADSLAGFVHYDEMCRQCHGAPGIGRDEFAQGMYPLPPTLVGIDTVWTPPQLFWIIKNGIKLTGMPAFGPTYSDEQIWHIVAFADHLSHLSYYEYTALQDSLGGEPMEEESGE